MGDRRKSREFALQLLYEMEVKGADPKSVLERAHEDVSEEGRKFATDLLDGTYRNRKEIDELIERHSLHWKMARMAVVDRNILRLAVYELLYLHDVPTSVVLNEAIEIAKKFGTEDSGAFINGILDKVAKEVRKA
ncbi:MAG TPA: transcription antitermination factor NusB [bacterium]|nr:transcription antitermination factor NusB [bacterium]